MQIQMRCLIKWIYIVCQKMCDLDHLVHRAECVMGTYMYNTEILTEWIVFTYQLHFSIAPDKQSIQINIFLIYKYICKIISVGSH